MDLTLFIILMLILISFIYGIFMISDLKKEVNTITGNKTEENYLRRSIDNLTYYLGYIRDYI
jgi:hypothetical protein